MLKPIATWFLAIDTALLQIYSKVYQYALKKINSVAYAKQKPTNLDEALPLDSFVSH